MIEFEQTGSEIDFHKCPGKVECFPLGSRALCSTSQRRDTSLPARDIPAERLAGSLRMMGRMRLNLNLLIRSAKYGLISVLNVVPEAG